MNIGYTHDRLGEDVMEQMEERGPSILLYLDDNRPCPPGFVVARNADECIECLTLCDVQLLSLDYDLGWGMPTGLEVVRFMVTKLTKSRFPREIYMHSSSAIGRMNMYQLLYMHLPDGVQLYNAPVPVETLQRAALGKLNVEK